MNKDCVDSGMSQGRAKLYPILRTAVKLPERGWQMTERESIRKWETRYHSPEFYHVKNRDSLPGLTSLVAIEQNVCRLRCILPDKFEVTIKTVTFIPGETSERWLTHVTKLFVFGWSGWGRNNIVSLDSFEQSSSPDSGVSNLQVSFLPLHLVKKCSTLWAPFAQFLRMKRMKPGFDSW